MVAFLKDCGNCCRELSVQRLITSAQNSLFPPQAYILPSAGNSLSESPHCRVYRVYRMGCSWPCQAGLSLSLHCLGAGGARDGGGWGGRLAKGAWPFLPGHEMVFASSHTGYEPPWLLL